MQSQPNKGAGLENGVCNNSSSTLNNGDQLNQHIPMEIDQSLSLTQENDSQMLRLIQQYLTTHGYPEVAETLQEKSKVRMEEHVVAEFRQAILSGEYKRAREVLSEEMIQGMVGERKRAVEYQLFEQEYLELMEAGHKMQGIQILQRELMPRISRESIQAQEANRQRLHKLAQVIMYGANAHNGKLNADIASVKQSLQNGAYKSEMHKEANWKGSSQIGRQDLLDRLQALMPSSDMLQPNRLEHIVKQSLAFQVFNCKYHNVQLLQGGAASYSLLENHLCQRQLMIPTKCIGILSKHKDEVWQVRFSPSGAKLATVGKDNLIYLWSLTSIAKSTAGNVSATKQRGVQIGNKTPKYRVKCTHEIKGHSKQINALNWSTGSDDKWLVTASNDLTAKVWDAKSGKLVLEIIRHQEAVMAAAFIPGNDNRLLTSAVDKLVILWEIRLAQSSMSDSTLIPTYEAVELSRIETRNYLDLAVQQSRFVAMGQNQFQVFTLNEGDDFKDILEEAEHSYEVETSDTVTSIALSKDGRHLLANVSLKQPRLELYDLGAIKCGQHSSVGRKAELIRRYRGGHSQENYILKCAFGGANEAFVLCGSEDATVSIWNKEKGDIVAKIGQDGSGHSSVINHVSWSPSDPFLFATASDDHTVRLWGTESMPLCDVIPDSRDLKRIDLLRPGNNKVNCPSANDEDDDEDYDDEVGEDEEEGQEHPEEEMEDEDLQTMHQQQQRVIIQATRVAGIREEDIEDSEEEEEHEWAGAQ